jgi:hypothetical protein
MHAQYVTLGTRKHLNNASGCKEHEKYALVDATACASSSLSSLADGCLAGCLPRLGQQPIFLFK